MSRYYSPSEICIFAGDKYGWMKTEHSWDVPPYDLPVLDSYLYIDPLGETGEYHWRDKVRDRHPIVWKHVKILSVKHEDGFKVNVEVFSKDETESKSHMFVFKNNFDAFIGFALKNLNRYIDRGFPFDKLKFDYLDFQCGNSMFKDLNQPFVTFEESHSLEWLYDFIDDKMQISAVDVNDHYYTFDEVHISYVLRDKYILYMFSEILGPPVLIDKEKQLYEFVLIDHKLSYEVTYQYEYLLEIERKAYENTDALKKEYVKKLRLHCIKKFSADDVVLNNMMYNWD